MGSATAPETPSRRMVSYLLRTAENSDTASYKTLIAPFARKFT